ncbi:hemolytic protein HlpA-like protein [Pseudanabaena sp. BC1403]|uniref:hemolytic protein HlpA-like protein n=1 Tax=Pseudanabaena sp. BC1403 TaxID=2043171 RepID=UPI000CD95E0D|nr:hemolytic protein HlpA-like protein [Pseudanabaena sp. BC1403]
MANLNTPVVFIIFNRPDLSQIVFESIRLAQPKQLFVIADGARFPEEFEKCKQTREIIKQVDWDCQVLTNYSDINLGCRQRVSSGINWVFEHVEEAIILEDDCLPHPSFFRYCQELLEHYREDERIWCISGDNFQDGQWRGNGSYYFSNYNHCWGWASWRRAWQHYDHDLSNWQTVRDSHYLRSILDSELEIKYWCDIFDKLDKFGQPNSWAYPWTFTCWQNSGLTILPNVNLVSNIGFRSDGTHITGDSKLANLPVKDIGKIYHPSFLVRDRTADEYTFDHVFGGITMKELALKNNTFKGKLINKLRALKSNLKSLKKHIKQ